LDDLQGIVSRALAAFSAAGDAASLENAKARFIGKSGELSALQATLKSLTPEQRKEFGSSFNAAKQRIEAALEVRRGELADRKLTERLSEQALDVTLPGRGAGRGGVHPVIPPGSVSRRSGARSASRSPTGRRSRPTGTTSPR
jgi:phenylalanyl-tRNA synthetase alpha chain